MDRLPQELIVSIVSALVPETRLPKEDDDGWDRYAEPEKPVTALAPFATISRDWQTAIERRTFKSLTIDSDDLPLFYQTISAHRYMSIKRLVYTAILPSYDAIAASKIESPQDLDTNDVAYSDAIHSLFKILKSAETNQLSTHNFELFLNHPVSRSDVQYHAGRGMPGPEGQIYEGRYYHSYIDLHSFNQLPELRSISRFSLKMPKNQLGHRMVYPRVPVQLVSKMTGLEALRIDVNDNERHFVDQRRKNRRDLSEQLQQLSLPNLKSADLHFLYSSPEDQRYVPPTLHPTTDFDLLSSVCHSFSQGLQELSLNGVFDATLLRPLAGLEVGMWPKLEQLDIHFHPVRPSGGWYFTGDPPTWPPLPDWDSQSKDMDETGETTFDFDREMERIGMRPPCYFRSTPDDDAIAPLVEAFADAIAAMPKLRNGLLHSSLVEDSDDPDWFVIAYVAPCERLEACLGKCHRVKERSLIMDLQGWTPTERVSNKLRGMGSKFHDCDVFEEGMTSFLSRHG